MPELIEVRTVPRSMDEVFAYTADFSNIESWDPGVASSQKVSPGPVGVGTQFELQVLFGSREIPMSYTVVEYREPTLVVLEGVGARLRAVDEISFRSVEEGTEILYSADLEFRGIARLFVPFMGRALTNAGRKALDGLAAALSDS